MKLQSLKIMGLIAMLFCAFQLGTIHEKTDNYKRIIACAKAPGNVSLQEFYGHDFRSLNLTKTIWNHATAHNAQIYMNCIFKDLRP